MRTIAQLNAKGGSCKTTATINIGAGLSRLGKKVLLVDIDPQAHLTYSLGIPAHELEKNIYHLLKGEATPSEVWIEKNGLTVIPSTLDLSGADIEFSSVPGREVLLKIPLETVKDSFDYCLIDCPPNLGLLTLNALTAAQEVYIVLQAEFLALQGMSKLLETVEVVKQRLNPVLEITGIIGARYDHRKNLNREVIEKVREYFGDKLFNTLIRDNIAVAEAPSFGMDIFTYKPNSYGAQDYMSLCKEILRRNGDE